MLKMVKPLFVNAESDLRWYMTYMNDHILALYMVQSRVDPYRLFQKNNRLL